MCILRISATTLSLNTKQLERESQIENSRQFITNFMGLFRASNIHKKRSRAAIYMPSSFGLMERNRRCFKGFDKNVQRVTVLGKMGETREHPTHSELEK